GNIWALLIRPPLCIQKIARCRKKIVPNEGKLCQYNSAKLYTMKKRKEDPGSPSPYPSIIWPHDMRGSGLSGKGPSLPAHPGPDSDHCLRGPVCLYKTRGIGDSFTGYVKTRAMAHR